MSCPQLILHATVDITIEEVAHFFDVKPKGAVPYGLGAIDFGPIEIYTKTPIWNEDCYQLGNKDPWITHIRMDTGYKWSTIGEILMLKLCAHFHEKKGGYYFVAFDTGPGAFAVGEEGLVLSERDRNHFSAFPIPFNKYAFARLQSA